MLHPYQFLHGDKVIQVKRLSGHTDSCRIFGSGLSSASPFVSELGIERALQALTDQVTNDGKELSSAFAVTA